MIETLAALRKTKGLTQEQLGRAIAERRGQRIGTTYAQKKIARWESGQAIPTEAELSALADVLGTDVQEIIPLLSPRAPYEGPAIIDQLAAGGEGERTLFAYCALSMARKESIEESSAAMKDAIENRNMWVAVFVPYPAQVALSSSSINNLVGYYTRVQRSISDANLIFKNRLDPAKADRIALYSPRTQDGKTSLLIPPIFRQYSLTIKLVDQPYTLTKTLHVWTPASDNDTARSVRPTAVYTIDTQIDAWESFYSEIIPHWIERSELSATDPYWQRIR